MLCRGAPTRFWCATLCVRAETRPLPRSSPFAPQKKRGEEGGKKTLSGNRLAIYFPFATAQSHWPLWSATPEQVAIESAGTRARARLNQRKKGFKNGETPSARERQAVSYVSLLRGRQIKRPDNAGSLSLFSLGSRLLGPEQSAKAAMHVTISCLPQQRTASAYVPSQ